MPPSFCQENVSFEKTKNMLQNKQICQHKKQRKLLRQEEWLRSVSSERSESSDVGEYMPPHVLPPAKWAKEEGKWARIVLKKAEAILDENLAYILKSGPMEESFLLFTTGILA